MPGLLPLCGVRSPTTFQLFGLMKYGHGDQAARRSLWDQPDIDLPCPLFMILPDWWESARFQAVFWLKVGSVKVALSRPAHQRVTPAVGQKQFDRLLTVEML